VLDLAEFNVGGFVCLFVALGLMHPKQALYCYSPLVFSVFFLLVVLGFELRVYTLHHFTSPPSPFFVKGFSSATGTQKFCFY
jgi:hypothetical protein